MSTIIPNTALNSAPSIVGMLGSRRPSAGSYNSNIPSIIIDPTPIVVQPMATVKPVTSAVDVTMPQNTSQIGKPSVIQNSIPIVPKSDSNKYLWYGLGIVAIIIIYFLLKKYRKI